MKNNEEDIKLIREMMEQSTKFLSLSGLSGISAGIFGLIGGLVALYLLHMQQDNAKTLLVVDAFATLLLSVGVSVLFSYQRKKREKTKWIKSVVSNVLYNLSIPLVVGGIICIIFLDRAYFEMIPSVMLMFYGLGLINASKYLAAEIHYLGLIELTMGVLAIVFVELGMYFWMIGFGLCQIAYGTVMYFRYDRN